MDKQKSYGKRYENAKVKVRISKRKLFYILSCIYFLGIIAIGVLWGLGV